MRNEEVMEMPDDEISNYREGVEQYPVKIRVLEHQRNDVDAIGKLTVPSPTGPVRIDNIARLALLEGRYLDAVAYAERAIVGAGDDDLDVAKTLFTKGRALTGLGRVNEAREAFLLAGDLFAG